MVDLILNGCGERKGLCWIKVALVFYYGKMNNKCELEWFDGRRLRDG
jgi:hypothetical protein